MSRPFDVQLPLERAYSRHVLFAVELLDAVTLERVSEGVEVIAEGLHGKPIVNAGGLFVWLEEDRISCRRSRSIPARCRTRRSSVTKADCNCRRRRAADHDRAAAARRLSVRGRHRPALRGTLIEDRDPLPPEPGRRRRGRSALARRRRRDVARRADHVAHERATATSCRSCGLRADRRPARRQRGRD